jgi:hypothetical protein
VEEKGEENRAAFIGHDLTYEEIICFTCGLAATQSTTLPLLQSTAVQKDLSHFLSLYQPTSITDVQHGPTSAATDRNELGWQLPFPEDFWRATALDPKRLVIAPAEPRRLLLQAACLAGALRAPLCVLHGHADETTALARIVRRAERPTVFAVGEAQKHCAGVASCELVSLPDEDSVIRAYLRHQSAQSPVRCLVLANPSDQVKPHQAMSSLAPWIAINKHAALVLTNEAGSDVRNVVQEAIERFKLSEIDSVIYVADLTAIPPERRPNPAPGKDSAIDMDPLTPMGYEPFTFATGRLFHKSPEQLCLMLGRQNLWNTKCASAGTSPKALVVSNPAGGLPLLEAFSRSTASEIRNAGYETTAIFGNDVSPEDVRRLLPQTDIFLWEGHHSTMTRHYGLPDWPEPLRPALVFLQSCLALCEEDSLPLLSRGAVAVLGTSNRTYSASGGACALAFFDALLYENQSLGGSLRHAKNFLVAYAMLKEKRLGEEAKLGGANLRSAWAFGLWGDPTLSMPPPRKLDEGLLSVRHEVHGNCIQLYTPPQPHDLVVSEGFQSQMFPNARLGGLIQKGSDGSRQLVPLLFAEVYLPDAPAGKTPRLHSRIPADHWVFNWDARRKHGYLLLTPRAKDVGELRFQIHWQ